MALGEPVGVVARRTAQFAVICVGVAFGVATFGQSKEVLRNAEIIALTKAGVGTDTIVVKIEASSCQFDTSTEAITGLKAAGVADVVITAMIKAGGGSTSAPIRRTSTEPTERPLRTVKGGILDEIRIYSEAPPSPTMAVVVRPFSATDADLAEGGQKGDLPKEAKDLQGRGPRLLATALLVKLKELRVMSNVLVIDPDSAAPAGALIVAGKFTLLDPGSRAKRYFVGFGSGKSGVAVAGSVTAPDGTVLAAFTHKRIGVMGLAGGDSTGKLVSDSTSIGEDIAEFLTAWTAGKKLK